MYTIVANITIDAIIVISLLLFLDFINTGMNLQTGLQSVERYHIFILFNLSITINPTKNFSNLIE